MTRVLITGASGFVGRAVVARLASAGFELTLGARARTASPHRQVAVGDISGTTDWAQALEGCAAVVHLAAQTPIPGATEEQFRTVNDEGTATLVRQAADAGVGQFLLMSSLYVATRKSTPEVVTDATPPPPPSDSYSRSKLAAEQHVAGFAAEGGAGISLRPAPVYGASGTGNWRMLQKLAASNLPLPLGSVRNRRSMISATNLADAVAAVVSKGAGAQSGAFVIADSEPLGLADVLRLLREGMGLRPRLLPMPPALMSGLLKIARKEAIAASLLGDLVVDSSGFRRTFGWSPPDSIRDGGRRSGAEYAASHLPKPR